MTPVLALQFENNQAIATGLFIVGVVFISAWLLMRLRKRNLRGPGYTTAQEHLERYKQKDAVRNDLEGLMVDIEQLAKRLGAQLDAKAIRVEKLIDDADLRIAQLQKAMQEQHAGLPAAPAPEATPEAVAETPAASPEEPADPLTVDVYRLADEGLGPPEIARRLDEHVGKIELILALRQA
ncbi:MAG: hypothetical protein AAF333_18445 [Planctomycetota bacterium]